MVNILIKCTQKQYNKIIKALVSSPLDSEYRCFLGKNQSNCPALTTEFGLRCETCLKRNIKRIPEVKS